MAEELKIGESAPAFSLPDQEGMIRRSDEFRGSYFVLYFYPKDNTSACTVEALAFSAIFEELSDLGVPVVGISPDSSESHRKFIAKHQLRLCLLSDPEHQVIEEYGVWALKKMYGKEYYGVLRTSYIISPEGKIARVWTKVKVKGHAEEVIAALKEFRI